MRLLASIQEIISKKNINSLVYNPSLKFPKHKSSLSIRLGIDYWSMIPDPPSNDSQQTTRELTEIISFANNRTRSEKELVYLVDNDPLDLFLPFLQTNNLSFPYKKFDNLYTYVIEIIKDMKYFYNRPRPFQLAEFYNVQIDRIITKTHQTPSYPSGHTAYCALASCILSELYPEHSVYFWSLTDKCGLARVLQGVHFPGDNAASVSLIQKVYNQLTKLDNSLFPNTGAKNGKI